MTTHRSYLIDGNQETNLSGNSISQFIVQASHQLYTDMIDKSFFIAPFRCKVLSLDYVATTPETGGTLTLKITRCQGVEAPASGDLLTSAALDMVGAALVTQTVYNAALTATTALLTLEKGDRLALDFTDDTAGELAGLVVTARLEQLS